MSLVKFKAFFTARLLADILLHVGFVGALLGLVFFSVGKIVETSIVKTGVSEVVDGYLTTLPLITTTDQRRELRGMLGATARPDMRAADAQVADSNSSLLKLAGISLGSCLVITLFISWWLSKGRIAFWNSKSAPRWTPFSMKDLLIEMIFIIISVAITELVFMFVIAKNNKPIDPNYIKLVMVKALQSYRDKP